MRELLERLIRVIENDWEFFSHGWITKSGEMKPIPNKEEHGTNALPYLRKHGVNVDDLEVDWIAVYCKMTGNIRYVNDSGMVLNITVASKPTSEQIETIKRNTEHGIKPLTYDIIDEKAIFCHRVWNSMIS